MTLKQAIEHILENWTSANKEVFTNHPLALFFRNEFHSKIRTVVDSNSSAWMTKASVGAGNWANVPWLSILNPKITETTEDGIYPVYLFCADGSGVYLSLIQGVTQPTRELGKVKATERAKSIKSYIIQNTQELSSWDSAQIELKATTPLGKSYETASIRAKFYPATNIPEDAILIQDLNNLLAAYQRIEKLPWRQAGNEETMMPEQSQKLRNIKLPKPFLLLAGISGTGKSRFVRQQAAKAAKVGSSRDRENYELVAVRPDWHEPSDLLGYVSRLSGTAEYVATPVLRFIVKAWQELLDKGCTLPDENGTLDDVLLTGTSEQLDAVLPYWLCLDEMNLAPVEQYFADYLALIETREWSWDDDNFEYSCGALLAADTLNALEAEAQQKLAVELGLTVEHLLWQHFLQHGIAIPPNLIVAGTVNMDETTHGFSRKVIDRAMSFDFGEFFPNDFDDFYTSSISQVPLTFPRYSSGKEALDDTDAKASIEFLQAINAVLKNTPFELAYRALNELLLAVHCHGASDNDADLQAVWDDFLMQKVLPRIEGDADKLQQDDQGDLLSRLQAVLETRLDRIWGNDPESPTRTDFYRTRKDSQIKIPCRSRQKIRWMRERLESSGFTSFWP
ncbi:MAG: DUF3578 domain-containing protein [Gammaproteobacteria bacterium]|nr:DUF3578 domain-containing protein [Gammaproteobacteria bacterium]